MLLSIQNCTTCGTACCPDTTGRASCHDCVLYIMRCPLCPLQLVEVDNIWVMEETAVCSAAKELDTLSLRIAGTHCSLARVARNTCMHCKAIFTYVGTAVCSPYTSCMCLCTCTLNIHTCTYMRSDDDSCCSFALIYRYSLL